MDDWNALVGIYAHKDALHLTQLNNTLVPGKIPNACPSLARELQPPTEDTIHYYFKGAFGTPDDLMDEAVMDSLERIVIQNNAIRRSREGHSFFSARQWTTIDVMFRAPDVDTATDMEAGRYQEVMNRFISAYRNITRDYVVPKWSIINSSFYPWEWYSGPLTDAECQMSDEELFFNPPQGQFSMKKWHISTEAVPVRKHISVDPVTSKELLKKALKHRRIEEWDRYLASAQERFWDDGDYQGAILDAFIALELSLAQFVEMAKQQLLPSHSAKRAKRSRSRIYDLLNFDLPQLLTDLSQEEDELLTKVNHVRKQRNDAVHEGLKITMKDAEEALSVVHQFILALDHRRAILAPDPN